MAKLIRFGVLLSLLMVLAVWARRRTAEFATFPYHRLQFEDLPPSEITRLELLADSGTSGNEPGILSV